MEIQIAIWTPDETHSSVRSWQPIFDDYNNDYIYDYECRAVRGREPRHAIEDLAHPGRNPERSQSVQAFARCCSRTRPLSVHPCEPLNVQQHAG